MQAIHPGECGDGVPPIPAIASSGEREPPDLWRERAPRLCWGVSVKGARVANVVVDRGQPVPVSHDGAWLSLFVVSEGEARDPRLGMVVRAGEAALTGRMSPPNLVTSRRTRLAVIAMPWVALPERTICSIPERTPTLLRHADNELAQLAHIGRNARGIGAILGCFAFRPIEEGVETTIRTLVCSALRIEGLPGLVPP